MKRLLLLISVLFAGHSAVAQYVFIPDSNFRNFIIQNIDSSAISGTDLDTTNQSVLSIKEIEIAFFNNQITDITGIQYFDSLQTLKINYLNLNFLPPLPPMLEHLEAEANAFTSLPDLPSTLAFLDVAFNSLATLPQLPAGITYLNVSSNFLGALPALPSLLYLNAANNLIASIDSFPDGIRDIILWDNELDSLPSIPFSVRQLNISDNNISHLPPLPQPLVSLYCSMNPLQSFPQLAEGIVTLECTNTLSCLPPLPNSLTHLNFDGCLSNRPLSMLEYYPLCHAEVRLIEVADSAAVCNDTLVFDQQFVSYLWNTGDTSNTLPGICRGIFTATLTDSIGCIYHSEIDITDTALTVTAVANTELSCDRVGTCGYVIDLTVSGGTPPYSYQWSDNTGEIDFTMISDTSQDLVHFCLTDILSVDEVTCIVTDAVGRQDSVMKTVFDNIPPEPFFIDIVNPVCPSFPTGYIYLEDDPLMPGGTIFIQDLNLDTGNYIYTIPFGNNCEAGFTIHLDYQFSDCSDIYSYSVTPPDSGLCNGTFTFYDNTDHGIYNLANISLAYDGMYLANGNSVPANNLCNNTWYYFYAFDFNIGYYVPDSVYISQPEYLSVYPGDANNDGVANNTDLLAIGLAYGVSGYPRADTSLSWSPKTVQSWADVFADSTNMSHADANGNGVVNAADTTAILLNYGLTHSRPNIQALLIEPSVTFEMPDTIEAGKLIEIPVFFGDSVVIADSVYGLAFTLQFDNAFIDASSLIFTADSSWMGIPQQDLITLQHETASATDIALTRTDHSSRTGYGRIGTLKFRAAHFIDSAFSAINALQVLFTDSAGNYIVGNGSSDSSFFHPASCVLNAQLTVTNGCYDLYGGSVEVNVVAGTAPYTINWTVVSSLFPVNLVNGPAIQDSLPTGTYQIDITDSAGCTDTLTTSVTSADGSLISTTLQNPSCPELCNGWIWLKNDSILGPAFNAAWSNGQSGAIITGLCDGPYQATVTWGSGCIDNFQFQLNDPQPLAYIVTVDTPSCNVCDGSITVTAFAGRQPYTFEWTSSTDTSFADNDSAATALCFNNAYSVTIADACPTSYDVNILFNTCDSTTSVAEAAAEMPVLYPNPNTGNFILIKGKPGETGIIEISDATGRIIYREHSYEAQENIELEGQGTGIYILSYYSENKVFRLPLVIE